ncbi:MAG: ABC transporter permease [Nitrospiraceae bacterium]|jgi:phospholipid/cholesterol/gamma-HCH transport system permease protein|nr:MAG: ABC transporter permease [Nitrospiraceae bacterium]UCH45459.1 MAG: ABC transporter permease [Nitrospiraceae bacterium]
MNVRDTISRLQDFYILSVKATLGIVRRPRYFREIIEQMDYMGMGSLFIVFLVSLFIGMALSLQISAELSEMGLKMYTGKIVGLSIIREIGPVAIALSFAGRVGSGMASEIGSMILGHQVDIMRVHGVNPVKKLVTPRVISAVIMLPALTIIGDAASLFGGYYISVFVSHQSGAFYWSQIKDIMDFENIFAGVTKPFIFGYLIACISCYMGLSTRGGARGLRQATTSAVVYSTIMIIVSDFLLTRVLLIVWGSTV